jgi:hypothetical protein
MNSAMSSPCSLHAIIYAGECYRSYFSTKTKESDSLRLHSKSEALKQLQEEIKKSNGIVSDEILLAISLLAIHGSITSRRHPESSLSLYRDLAFSRDAEFYSSTDCERVHLYALYALVERRGGLKSILLPGLANMIAM